MVHPLLLFSHACVTRTSSQKHLGIIHYSHLKFDDYLKMVSGEISRTIGILHKLQNLLPIAAPITIYETFIIFNLGSW